MRDALGLGQAAQIFGRAEVDIDESGREAGTDGDLVHIDVGRVEQRAAFGDRQHRQRVGHGLGAERRALQRIDGDVDFRAVAERRVPRRYRASALRRARPRR